MNERLAKQLEFIIEIDKIKSIIRHSKLFDGSKLENDAEHSWTLAMMALVLAEHSKEPIDIAKVVKMVLIHDIVEIDVGDTIFYNVEKVLKKQEETKAAKRIFGLLPQEQSDEFILLWEEFEDMKTPEAKFAATIDRLEPILQTYKFEPHAWKEYNITSQILFERNKHINEGSTILWDCVVQMVSECRDKGLIE